MRPPGQPLVASAASEGMPLGEGAAVGDADLDLVAHASPLRCCPAMLPSPAPSGRQELRQPARRKDEVTMHILRGAAICGAILLSLAACQSGPRDWTKPGAGPGDLERDRQT